MTKLVLPNHTNSSGQAFGGWVLKQLDLAAFNAAQRHHRGSSPPVTVSIDHVSYLASARVGQILTVDAVVTRTFGSSMEVEVSMHCEEPSRPEWGAWPVLKSFATFVAVGDDGRSVPVSSHTPSTLEGQVAFDAAGRRRAGRLERRQRGSGGSPSFVQPRALHAVGDASAPRGYVEMTESVFSRHTNARGTAFGGQLLAWGGVACSISAMRHAGASGLLLAASDEVAFLRPVRNGDTVVVRSEVTAQWRSSLEVGLTVEREDPASGDREHCLSAYFSYVMPVDAAGRRTLVPASAEADAPGGDLVAEERRARRLQAAKAG